MNWNKLEQVEQLVDIDVNSHEHTIVIFKHSTRCSISATALSRLERSWNDAEMSEVKPYYLDLLNFRTTSNAIATHYNIEHQSPQVLVIKDGHCVYHESHMAIDYNEIKQIAHS
jgi:bacillithiol system protein YtxJ